MLGVKTNHIYIYIIKMKTTVRSNNYILLQHNLNKCKVCV